jgi:hypothetical protein
VKTSRKPRRRRASAQHADLGALRKLLRDRRTWCAMARVEAHEGQVEHFELATGEDGERAVYVDVVTIPGNVELRARLAGDGGLWRIPAVGTLCYVGLPDGQIDGYPVLMAVVGAPTATSGLATDTVVLQLAPGQRLVIHDGDAGEAFDLPTMADFNALREYVARQFDASAGHVHVVSGAATTTQTTGTAPAPAPTTPPPTPAGTETVRVK